MAIVADFASRPACPRPIPSERRGMLVLTLVLASLSSKRTVVPTLATPDILAEALYFSRMFASRSKVIITTVCLEEVDHLQLCHLDATDVQRAVTNRSSGLREGCGNSGTVVTVTSALPSTFLARKSRVPGGHSHPEQKVLTNSSHPPSNDGL